MLFPVAGVLGSIGRKGERGLAKECGILGFVFWVLRLCGPGMVLVVCDPLEKEKKEKGKATI